MTNFKRMLVLGLFFVLSVGGAIGQQKPSKQKQPAESKWLKQAKADYARMKLEPLVLKPLNKSLPSQICIVEVDSGTPIDMACAIPQQAGVASLELFAKNGVDGDLGFDWKPCDTTGLFRCHGVDVGWWGLGVLPEDSGLKAIQIRIVPDHSGGFRGRMRITYQ